MATRVSGAEGSAGDGVRVDRAPSDPSRWPGLRPPHAAPSTERVAARRPDSNPLPGGAFETQRSDGLAMKGVIFLVRLGRDERGIVTVEIALAIALFALVAAGGFFVFGGALAAFFEDIGIGFSDGNIVNPLDSLAPNTFPDPCEEGGTNCGSDP